MNHESAISPVAIAPRTQKRAPNFDHLAPLYRWMEWVSFGPFLALCRRAFLPALTGCRHALILGDGDGRFTAALLQANPRIEVDALDISHAMLERLRRRAAPRTARLRTEVQDLRNWTPLPGRVYDLVVTHFFLDCLTTSEVRALATRLRPRLAPGSRWIVSEFAIPSGAYGLYVARLIVALLYLAFRLLTGLRVRRLPDHGAALAEAGFVLQKQRKFLAGLLVSQTWLLIKTAGNSP